MSLNPTQPGGTWSDAFIVTDSSGAPAAPDSAPVAVLYVNKAPVSTTVTVTQAVDNAAGTISGSANGNITGSYFLSATLTGRSNSDVVRALVKYTISSVSYLRWSDSVRLVQWGATTLPSAAARTSTGLAALADLQANSTLGPAQTITDGDGTASLIQIATPFVGAAIGRGLRCTDTLETRQITAFSQNIGSGLWQYSVAPAFTTFTNPYAHTFAVVNMPSPIVDASGNARAVDSSGGSIATSAAAAALSGTINATIYAPATGSTLDLFRGDSYQTADGRGITITKVSSEAFWPTTLSTVHFTCKPTAATLVDSPTAASLSNVACTVVTATGATQAFTLELSSAQMATLQAGLTRTGGYSFWFIANKDNGPATLRAGSMTVRADPSA